MKLATKFTAVLLIGVLTLIAIEGYVAVLGDIELLDAEVQRGDRELGQKLKPLCAAVWEKGGDELLLSVLEELNRGGSLSGDGDSTQQFVHVRLVWLDAQRDDPHCPLAAPDDLNRLSRGDVVSIRHRQGGDEHLLTYVHLAVNGPRPSAIELAEPLGRHAEQRMRSFFVRMMILTSLTLLLGVLLVLLLGRQLVTKPLHLLIDKTRRIGRGDLAEPIEMKSRDEFGELGASINVMCDQLAAAREKIDEEAAARIAALDQLRHADRLRTVGRLASGIAHELGTPLNVVGGRAEMIASGRLSSDETKKNAEAIKSEADRITNLVRQLLDFARRNTPQRTTTDVRKLADQTVSLLAPLAEKRGVHIDIAARGDALACDVDPGQIQQVLTNLVLNAVQSMSGGGKVELDIGHRRVRPPDSEAAAEGEYLVIAVRDQGAGIADEDLPQIFEPFFTTKDVGEGTGLGLSIAHSIVQEHGGWIGVESRAGQGSCFTVYLPREVK